MALKKSSRTRLSPHTVGDFPADTLHDALGRVISEASCLPRKEFFEAWAVAKRVRRRLRAPRVVDMAAGHGLVAFILLMLDREIREAVCVDRRQPESFSRLQTALAGHWPRLGEQVRYVEGRIEEVPLDADTLVVSVHGCGVLTDRVLDLAIAARAPVAVLPCCHAIKRSDTGDLTGWLDDALAVDVTRAVRLQRAGYRIYTQTIPEAITPKNRLLLGSPG